jgi:radical SAM protein with 4Fe4S-binding SPASM domain
MQELLTMSRKELDRVPIIELVVSRKLTQVEAGSRLGLTDRHVRRLVAAFTKSGPSGLIHRLRGKPSNHRLPQELKNKTIDLVKEKYSDFGPTFASEKLAKIDGIIIDHNLLRAEMIRAGLWQIKQRKPKHRQWRERRKHYGELVQFDGSHHDWFESRNESEKCGQCNRKYQCGGCRARAMVRTGDYLGADPDCWL